MDLSYISYVALRLVIQIPKIALINSFKYIQNGYKTVFQSASDKISILNLI